MSHLTAYERETIITFNDEDANANIYTCNKTLQQKLSMMCADSPEYFLIKEDEDSKTYECPKSLIQFRKPYKLSESAREKKQSWALEMLKRKNQAAGKRAGAGYVEK